MLGRVLAEDGYSVTTVGSGRQALRALQDVAFEVIILDMSLPDADGTELLREIRAEVPYVRILALSGMMVNGMQTAARAAGADATLAKPATARRLIEAVDRLIESRCCPQ